MATVKKILSYNLFLSSINALYRNYFSTRRSKFGYIDPTSRVRFPILIKGIENVFLYENTHILGRSLLIATKAKFIMKKNSGAAEGFIVVTGNHPLVKGELYLLKAGDIDMQNAKDIVVEEDVGIGTNVTLLAGVVVGRGAVIGSGSVIRKSVPPYAIMAGNPAKVIGFRFSPQQTIEHEIILYPLNERLSLKLLQENYQKFFVRRIKDIRSFLG
ncbi:MAG: galactoside O-acetyltransferase [Bacteroidota bacterium]|nr:galactoside O-acetyltransferase [Bacteroidota bacterium]